MNKFTLLAILLVATTFFQFAKAQSPLAPYDADYYHLLQRYEAKQGRFADDFQGTIQPLPRHQIAAFTDSLIADTFMSRSRADRFNLQYLANDNTFWSNHAQSDSTPFLKYFYEKPAALYSVDTDEFGLRINPVLQLAGGTQSNGDNLFINSRGAEISGHIARKVGFYSFFSENQVNAPAHVIAFNGKYNVLPQERFWKKFGTNGYDFITARGYITYSPIKQIMLQMGHDRHFIGNGYRSMILSDFAPAYFFFKADTKVWRIRYTNLFTRLQSDITADPLGSIAGEPYNSKFMIYHRLGLNITNNLNVGLFESIVTGRRDSGSGRSEFAIEYLNPLIFYRAVEQHTGSPDNALLGADFRWLPGKGFSLYGQLFLDEFVLNEIRSSNNWWGNKYAFQVGGKYIDVAGLKNLDLQAEFNMARPYVYAYADNFGSYSHFNQPLAHPLGANFQELVGILRYQPLPRLRLQATLTASQYGADTGAVSYGQNVIAGYNSRPADYGIEQGQGLKTNLLMGDFTASYMAFHNLFADVRIIYRSESNDRQEINNTAVMAGIRWNIGRRPWNF